MFKRIGKKLVYVPACIATTVTLAGNACADLVDVSSISLETAGLGTIGGLAIAGLAGIWGFRKIVKSINRS